MIKLNIFILVCLSLCACGSYKTKKNVNVFIINDDGKNIQGPKGMRLVIPPFTVDDGVEITISTKDLIISDAEQASSVFELKPVNLDLSAPADLVIPYFEIPGLSPLDMVIFTSKDSDLPIEQWQRLESKVSTKKQKVSARIQTLGYFFIGKATKPEQDTKSEDFTEINKEPNTLTEQDNAKVVDNRVAMENTDSERAKTKCHGTEPFWGLTITDDLIEFNFPDMKTFFSVQNEGNFSGFTADFAQGFVGKSANGERITVSIINKGCSDGMSDYIWDYTVIINTGDSFYLGCCGTGRSTLD